jgi:magnesium transporter
MLTGSVWQISIENATVNQRINDVMKRFSAIATILLPLSLVAGLFGMNIGVPGQVRADTLCFFSLCVC